MIRFRWAHVLLLTTALVAVSAVQAADLPKLTLHKKATVSVPESGHSKRSWSGFHVGIGGGGNMMTAKSHVRSDVSQSYATDYTESYNSSIDTHRLLRGFGKFAAIEAGYDQQFDQIVVGGFVDYRFGSTDTKCSVVDTTQSSNDSPYNFDATATQSQQVHMGNSFDVGGRLGYLVSDRTLVYGLAGYSMAQIKATAEINVEHGDGSSLNDFTLQTVTSGLRSGYTVGAGFEHLLTDDIALKVEYRFSDYGKIHSSASSDAGGQGTATISQESKIQNQALSVVLSYHF
jgi:outer membrane immunogenic protein